MSTACDVEVSSIPADHRDVQSTHVDSMGWRIWGFLMPVRIQGCTRTASRLGYLLYPGDTKSLCQPSFVLSTGTGKYIQEREGRGWDQSFRIQAIGYASLFFRYIFVLANLYIHMHVSSNHATATSSSPMLHSSSPLSTPNRSSSLCASLPAHILAGKSDAISPLH